MPQIVPAFLVESEQQFEKQLRAVEHDCSLIQIDILDGTLFPHTSWFDPIAIGQLKTSVEIELHLMVENPIPIIEAFQKHVPTLKRAIVSAEMHRPIGAVTSYIKDILGLEVGVAINPETPIKEIEEVLHTIDQLTVMGVHPGSMGQPFEGDAILDKIKLTKHHRPDLCIEIDGGVTEQLIPSLLQAGVDRIVSGSVLFKSSNPAATLKQLNQLI
ncbi:hypothetical protein A3E97_04895 [Candidatus Uhrbacteria bacterium RIFCSPHIGHO2_12_FULL_47_12]|uniref:Ribulose-phosphate 3-epimerase n=1 Tax=Candidatus Uhrbacteria bacterium RIFCSPLOWO2_02_FULL_48_18 TaxID=1802408 RepID=A0A1F7V891_9BACT|nr:MAG: hypothetical protein A3E97_04895 [Candidatus Uhrbacteria bacterium RIFCSPHIGHO2_12_FULL_47_12]OGL80428.1 MAG: hypothetical protein A3B20_03370 [Candidatus Uhrbacteria bacterium RIFCSPLOWO2_01_FULL_47_17]OGL86288.1 MAG: hypothetical protein A3I41_01850 [Candidatus Uhrbacteria bacterium RIFCSPLOWO2_02_FULL_48_18]